MCNIPQTVCIKPYSAREDGTNNTLISSAGMETKASRSAATAPTVPQAVSAATGEHEGEIILSWKPVPNARSYTIEFNLDPATRCVR